MGRAYHCSEEKSKMPLSSLEELPIKLGTLYLSEQFANLPGRLVRKVFLRRKINLKKSKNFVLGHKNWCGQEGEKKVEKYILKR